MDMNLRFYSTSTASRRSKATLLNTDPYVRAALALLMIFLTMITLDLVAYTIMSYVGLSNYKQFAPKRRPDCSTAMNITFEKVVPKVREEVVVVLYDYDYPEINGPNPVQIGTISKPSIVHKYKPIQASDAEKELLALLSLGESENQGKKGQKLVIDVVLNRVRSNKFPNNINDVIFASGQFAGIKRNVKVTKEALENVEEELNGFQEDYTSLYFGRVPITQSNVYKYKDHYFSN